ncbi:hypothetical protein MMC26_002991 [Xylographa opegraphella]|nr:hypothetical protein [Xylographa opegraphella]
MGGGPDKTPEHLLCTLPFPEPKAVLDRIRKNHPQIQITYRDLSHQDAFAKESGIPDDLWREATILVTLSALPPTPAACPKLELIHFFSAGTNHVQTHPIYKDSTIPLTTSSGIHGPQIAEWVLLTSLVASHSYHTLHSWQTQHLWRQQSQISRLRTIRDNVGQRLGVLGYGSIGRQVARVAHAMGMDVIAFTASARPTPESKRDGGFIVPGTGDPDGSIPSAWYSGLDRAALHRFLAQDIDWLVVSVPLTAATQHLLGAPEFAILAARNAFVSNISRGQIVVQADLIAALEAYVDTDGDVPAPPPQGSATDDEPSPPPVVAERGSGLGAGKKGLRGAALDVTDPEPLPAGDPLWDAPNCIVTPHISGLSVMYADRAFQVLEVNLRRREEGRGLINEVGRERGY